MYTLLLVEDDPNIQNQLKSYLHSEGFNVIQSDSLQGARDALSTNRIDLVLLDWNLPDGQGIDLLKEPMNPNTSIIFLTARQDLIDKVLGLEMGAIDYITKPFEPRELLARIRAHLHFKTKNTQTLSPTIKFADIEVNKVERVARWKTEPVALTKKEFDLLLLFLENPGKVFSRDELLNMIWGYEEYPTTRTVDNHILKLRQVFAEDFFETVRGVGYRLKRMAA